MENNFDNDNVVEQYSRVAELLSGICDKHPELMTGDMQKKKVLKMHTNKAERKGG